MRLIDPKRFLKEIFVDRFGHIDTTITGLNIAMERSEVEAEPVKHGRWIVSLFPGSEHVSCSECGAEYYEDDLLLGGNEFPRYCPNCGAKMDEILA